MKKIKFLGWMLGILLGVVAIVLAILASIFSSDVLDYVALGLLVAALLIEIVAAIVEINPKKDEIEEDAEPSKNGKNQNFEADASEKRE